MLEVETNPGNSIEVHYELKDFEKWKHAIDFASHYFAERLQKANEQGISIKIVKLDWMTVDTTSILVFYAFLKGLSTALVININDKTLFNESDGTFCFVE